MTASNFLGSYFYFCSNILVAVLDTHCWLSVNAVLNYIFVKWPKSTCCLVQIYSPNKSFISNYPPVSSGYILGKFDGWDVTGRSDSDWKDVSFCLSPHCPESGRQCLRLLYGWPCLRVACSLNETARLMWKKCGVRLSKQHKIRITEWCHFPGRYF